MAQIVRFVDRPGGTTLLDVSPGQAGVTVGDGGVQSPPPPLRRSVSDNPVQDGGNVTASSFGLRTVTLPLVYSAGVQATTAAQDAARRAAVRAIIGVLTRDRVWLELRADGATESRYLWCYRSLDDDLVARLDGIGERWVEMTVELLADPFAYGPKETLATQTTTLAGDFKTTIAGSGIKGDVAAPLIILTDGTSATTVKTMWMASKVGGAKHKCVVEFDTLGFGTPPSGSTYTSGVTLSQAINGSADKWSAVAVGQEMTVGTGPIITTPGGGADLIDGSYRVLLFAPTISVTADGERWGVELRMVLSAAYTPLNPKGGVTVGQRAVQTTATSYGVPEWFDLGVVEVPYGGRATAPGFDPKVNTAPAAMQVVAKMEAQPSPPSERYWDALLVLPADDTMLTFQWTNVNTGVRNYIIDPHTGTVVVRASGANVSDAPKVSAVGSTPFVVPGVNVDVYAFVVNGGNGLAMAGAPAGVSYTPSYWPRYLTVV